MINRIKKSRSNPYVVLPKKAVQDDRLTWKARGVLAYLLSLPDDWQFYESELVKHSKDGRDSLRGALRELESLGYIQRQLVRNERGQYAYNEWEINDDPVLVQSVFSSSGLSVAGKSVHGQSVDELCVFDNNESLWDHINSPYSTPAEERYKQEAV